MRSRFCSNKNRGGTEVAQKPSISTTPNDEKPFDVTGFIIDFEEGLCTDAETINGFQHLIDSGLCWKLQGYYGRVAQSLIDDGYCTRK